MKNIAVFASGGGSDFQSVVDGVESGLIDGKIVLLVASREGIGALERAKKHGIDSAVFDKKKFASDEEMFSAIGDELVRRGTELIVLAGYLNILPPRFVERFAKNHQHSSVAYSQILRRRILRHESAPRRRGKRRKRERLHRALR